MTRPVKSKVFIKGKLRVIWYSKDKKKDPPEIIDEGGQALETSTFNIILSGSLWYRYVFFHICL